ncbi:MAG: hypothetical protein SRB2_03081 [Desulfobacteraceae bacterium Eth-SRB2]|nr:MAG: hypothetical protein SRB2_03081 [Desulfobacteraceae bacterium Eth-SRB2]
MLVIRAEQAEALKVAAVNNFVKSMVAHIKEFFPNHFRVFTGKGAHVVAEYAVKRARRHDFVTERNVCLYLNVMLILGSNFDDDPQLGWTTRILKDEDITDPSDRADILMDKTLEYFDVIAGVNNRQINRTFLKLDREFSKAVSAPSQGPFEADARNLLKWINPNKYEAVGDKSIRELIEIGMDSANQYEVFSESGMLLYISLMFILGSGFDRDPQAPWAKKDLNDPNIETGNERADQLLKDFMSNLKLFLKNYHSTA